MNYNCDERASLSYSAGYLRVSLKWLKRKKRVKQRSAFDDKGQKTWGTTTRRRHDRLASYDVVSQAVSATTLTPELKSVTLSYPTFTLSQLTCSG